MFISGYSKNTPYESLRERLENSFKKFDLFYKIYAFEDKGWIKNCQQKAKLIRQAMIEFSTNIVWIDIDAEVERDPVFFKTLSKDVDICCYWHETKDPKWDLMSGTLYFGDTANARIIIKEWIEVNNITENLDQLNLRNTIKRRNYNIVQLPVEYISLSEPFKGQPHSDKPVITHYQASREYRNKI